MTIMRISVFALVAAMACAAPGPSPSTVTRSASSRMPFDSATAERLCVRPDLVRAGIAECVLKDQSPPLREIRRPPPPR